MSNSSTLHTTDHFRYIAERTIPEDAFLTQLREEAQQLGIPPIWVSPEQAACMRILLKACKVRHLVEVGCLAGYSAISMARALPEDGRVDTIELNTDYAEFAERKIAASDVAGRVRVHRGAGADVLATFPDASVDAIFIDADKANYPAYLKEGCRIVRSGGIIMADNAFAFGQLFDSEPTDPGVPHIRSFNEIMAKTDGLEGIILPIGDGCWFAVKK